MRKILVRFTLLINKLLDFRENSVGYLLRLVLVYLVLQSGFQLMRGSVVEEFVIDMATVEVSALLINQLSPGERVVAIGDRLKSPRTQLRVLNGCEGVESIFLVIAAIINLPRQLRYKMQALVFGTLIVYVLNQFRIVVLYYSLQYDVALFDALHGYVAPVMIVMTVCIMFVGYLKLATSR